VTELIDLLDLEEIEIGLFRARQPDTQLQRVFGGQVLAQALIAAARTVSVLGYYIRCTLTSCCPGGPTVRWSMTWSRYAMVAHFHRAALWLDKVAR
jgi:hypothetical protein